MALAHFASFRRHIADDAFITMRYSIHLATGEGPVYNRGERVEGYTSPLWMATLAAMCRLGVDLPTGAVLLGVLAGLITIWMVARFPWKEAPQGTQAVAALLLACSGSFIVWSKSGLETGLFALLVLSTLVTHVANSSGTRSAATVGMLAALATLTRPEGVLLFAFVLARDARNRSYRRVLVSAAPFVVLVGGHLLWRYAYYESLIPNSAQAKIGFSTWQLMRGVGYMADFVATHWAYVVPAALALVLRMRATALVVFVAMYSSYIVLVGGDHFAFHRFFSPVLPLISLIAAAGVLRAASTTRHTWIRVVAIGVTCVGAALPSAGRAGDVIRHDTLDVQNWSKLGQWLSVHLGPGDSIALNPIGAVGYYSGLQIIDMLGITDAHVARAETALGRGPAGHERADGAYVLSRQPTLILLGVMHPAATPAGRLEPVYESDRQVLREPRLRTSYTPVIIQVEDLRFVALRRMTGTAAGKPPSRRLKSP